MLPALFLFVFARHDLLFRFVVGLSLLLGILVFPRMSSLHVSPSHLVLRHSSYCYRVRSPVVAHWLGIENPPLKSRVTGPLPTLQSICRFSLASASLSGCTCPQGLTVLGLRSSFVANGSVPLDHFVLHFFSAPLPLRPSDTDPRPGFAANRSCFSRPHFLVSFRHTCP